MGGLFVASRVLVDGMLHAVFAASREDSEEGQEMSASGA